MGAPIYSIGTEADVTLTAATARTVLGAKAHANSGLILKGVTITFQGVSATGEPALVEVCYSTWATNSPGTNSTSGTVRQGSGRVLTAGFTGGYSWTAGNEPTTLTMLEPAFFVHPQAGVIIQIPLGDEYDCALAEGFAIRVTAAAGVDLRAGMRLSRC
jgi:hypothetical protein